MQAEKTRKSFFKNWETSLKIPSLFFLMLAMALVRNSNLIVLLPIIAVALFFFSGISLSLLFSRLKVPASLLLFVSLFMILFSGDEILFKAGFISIRTDGIYLAINMCIRVLSVVSVGIVMVNSTSLSGLSGKLKSMMLPSLLVDIGVMTGRYIMVIGEDYDQMKIARKLRGYVPGKSITGRFKVTVPTAATLLIRGFEQSEMVFNAMKMRGYGNAVVEEKFSVRELSKFSVYMSLSVAVVALLLVVLEFAFGTV